MKDHIRVSSATAKVENSRRKARLAKLPKHGTKTKTTLRIQIFMSTTVQAIIWIIVPCLRWLMLALTCAEIALLRTKVDLSTIEWYRGSYPKLRVQKHASTLNCWSSKPRVRSKKSHRGPISAIHESSPRPSSPIVPWYPRIRHLWKPANLWSHLIDNTGTLSRWLPRKCWHRSQTLALRSSQASTVTVLICFHRRQTVTSTHRIKTWRSMQRCSSRHADVSS